MSTKGWIAEIKIDVRTGQQFNADAELSKLTRKTPKHVIYNWDIIPPDSMVTENFLEREIAHVLLKKKISWPDEGTIQFRANIKRRLYEIVLLFDNHCACASLKWKWG